MDMSAFVIDEGTMNRVVRAICHKNRYGQVIRKFMGIDTSERDAPTRIGRLLFTLNIEAVMQRYPDCEEKPGKLPGSYDAPVLPQTYRAKINPMGTLVDGYKAVRCLIYQCSEGDVDQSECYRALDAAAGEIAHCIVSGLPAYEAAGW
jgi:hypothetical protein